MSTKNGGVRTPPPRFVSQCQNFSDPPSAFVRQCPHLSNVLSLALSALSANVPQENFLNKIHWIFVKIFAEALKYSDRKNFVLLLNCKITHILCTWQSHHIGNCLYQGLEHHQIGHSHKIYLFFLFSRFTKKDTTLTTGDLFSLGKLVYTRFLVGSGLKAGRT